LAASPYSLSWSIRLPGADVAQLRRAVGCQHDQRDPRLRASITAGNRFAAAVPEVHVTATGLPLALAAPSAKKPAARSSMCDQACSRGRGQGSGRSACCAIRAGAGVLHPAAHELVEQRTITR